ncbi:hypothetical protein [Streptomyces canus]|uniref:hypothetical protein n=1 Tax=Streptomyces canus TaxID=58343 RepID=UPI0032487826
MTVDVHLGDEQGLDRSRRYLRPVARLQLPDEPDLVHLAVYEWLPQFEAWATGPAICGRSTTQGPLPEGTLVNCNQCAARRPEYEGHFAALVPRQPDAAPAVYDAATLAVLHAMEKAAEKHLDAIRPHNTKRSYANDWALWEELHDWLAERTGQPLPLTAFTKGTLVGFVVWLDTIKLAAPNSIDRRITESPSPRAGSVSKYPKSSP